MGEEIVVEIKRTELHTVGKVRRQLTGEAVRAEAEDTESRQAA